MWRRSTGIDTKVLNGKRDSRLDMKSFLKRNKTASFWMDDALKDSYGYLNDYSKMTLMIKNFKAIRNFVSILTNKNIPVKYSTREDKYFTDGESITISADINAFDITCGAALHEASHILLTNFGIFKKFGAYLMAHYNEMNYDFLDADISPITSENYEHKIDYYPEEVKETIKLVKSISNWIEDRRIDNFIVKTAPGYKGYYDALYKKYFLNKDVSVIVSKKCDKINIKSYMFYIINSLNKKLNVDALPGLKAIIDLIDVKNIDRLKETLDTFNLAIDVVSIIYANIKEEEKRRKEEEEKRRKEEEELDKDSKTDSDSDSEDSKIDSDSDSEEVKEKEEISEEVKEEEETKETQKEEETPEETQEEEETPKEDDETKMPETNWDSETEETNETESDEIDENETKSEIESEDEDKDENSGEDSETSKSTDENGEGDDSEIDSDSNSSNNGEGSIEIEIDDDEVSDSEYKEINKILKQQEDFIDHNTKKRTTSDSMANTIKNLTESDVEVSSVGSAEILIIKANQTSYANWSNLGTRMIQTVNLTKPTSWDKVHTLTDEEIQTALLRGTQLGKKLLIRNEERSTKYSRLTHGKIENRQIYNLGYENTEIFFQTRIDKYKKTHLHISIDASVSMDGDKFKKALSTTITIIKAASMTQNINVVVDMRATEHQGNVCVIIYDSRKDSINKVKTTFRQIFCTGSTPEALVFDGLLRKNYYIPSTTELNSYFLNFSDGEPTEYCDEMDKYDDDEYGAKIGYNRAIVNKIKELGIEVISYFITSYDTVWAENNMSSYKVFQYIYGKDAKLINTDNITALAKTMNDKFLTK